MDNLARNIILIALLMFLFIMILPKMSGKFSFDDGFRFSGGTIDHFNPDQQFYMRNNRYLASNMGRSKYYLSPLGQFDSMTCMPPNDWNVKYESGANNTVSDILWHKSEPRMILENSCLDCNLYKDKIYNAPEGVESSLISTTLNL